jgi:4-oxalocrotonate tautomerase
MPHVIVKLWPGRSGAQKQELSDAIVRDVTSILGYGDEAVSVGFEEVPADRWSAEVYGPDIQDRWQTLTKPPGYGPGAHHKSKGQAI